MAESRSYAFRQYFDRSGQRITGPQWLELFGNPDYVILAKITIPGDGDVPDTVISTVWFGHNQWSKFGEQPLIFETDVFEDGALVKVIRTATEAAALAEHEAQWDAAQERHG